MARRSDFAQKLLDDLRVRKERMAASHNSKSSKPVAGDVYSYSKQAYRGSREMKTHQTTGFRNGSAHGRTAGANKSFSIREASKEIVPFERGRNTEHIGDLSMALAFALENGGKLRRMDSSGNNSMLGFLNQISRRSVDMGRMERSTSDRHGTASNRFPTISHLHIKEISKGAQKLNQILRACSNGLNFDSYSIEIGKELLKGAMDLEESLRMLVNLQEASEYMITPQSKTRITLLDDDENEEDDNVQTAENKQLARPTFSFDKPSRNSHYIQEAARSDLMQRLMALTYQSENTKSSSDARNSSTSNSASHRRSTSNNPNMKSFAGFSEQRNHTVTTISKPEKARIPNVIAKLMGLEELPENGDPKSNTKKESNSRERMEQIVTKKTAVGSNTHERNIKEAGSLMSPTRKHKQVQSNQILGTQDKVHGMQAERNLVTHQASFEGTIHDGRSPQKNVESAKATRSLNNAHMKIDKQLSNRNQSSQSMGNRKDIQEKDRNQNNMKLRERKGKEKYETKELIPKHQLQQMALQQQNGTESAITMKEQEEFNLTTLKIERRDSNKFPSNNQPKSLNNIALQQPQTLQNFESQKHYARESEKQSIEPKTQLRKQTRGESKSLPQPAHDSANLRQKHLHTEQPTLSDRNSTESIGTMQFVGVPSRRHHEDVVQDTSSSTQDDNRQDSVNKNSNKNFSTRNLNAGSANEKNKDNILPDMEEEPIHVLSTQKVKATKVQKPEAPQKIDELVARRSGNPPNLSKTLKHQMSISQEVKKRRQHRPGQSKEEEQVRSSRSAEACILKSNRTVLIPQKSNKLEELQNQASNLTSPPMDNVCQSLKQPEIVAPDANSSRMINDQQGQEHDFGIDKLSSQSSVLDQLDRTHEVQMENRRVSKLEKIEPLTESENHLKQILVKSQLFLNTAEALFKLNIPFNILNEGGCYDCQEEERKLLFDCGYEVMKRKGKRKELSVHPFTRISITCLKVRSLDDLVKQLNKDMDKLKFYGRNGKAESVVEDCLAKMLEIDVYSKDPDVNCMWDIGWQEMMFTSIEKDDVIRDVEKHMLNGLLDEIAKDLLLPFLSLHK